jgi:hypothetical protein
MRAAARVVFATLFMLSVAPALGWAAAPDPAGDEQTLRAAWIATDGPGLVKFFRQRTILAADPNRIAALVRQLGSEQFRVRSQASADLVTVGVPALPHLRRVLKDPDIEVRQRARACIEAIKGGRGMELAAAAVRLLKQRRPAGGCGVLLAYLPGADGEVVEEETLLALADLGLQGGKADPALVKALADPAAPRRAAAALLLGRSGSAEQRAAVRRRLADADPRVRLRAAQGLLAAGERAAVPALVKLLGDGPQEVAEEAEDLLRRLTRKQPPALGNTPATRRRCREAWRAWWQARPAKWSPDRSRTDLLTDPALRAGRAARRFLRAWLAGDLNAVHLMADVPFNWPWGTLPTRARLDQYLALVPSVWKQQKLQASLNAHLPAVVPLDEYLRTTSEYDDGLEKLPRRGEVRVVYVHSNVYRGTVLVRVAGAWTRILGLGVTRYPGHRMGHPDH